jgi:indolepyruvate ferredoxin oxidoreductase
MARLRFLRGTPFDPFGWTAHRRLERRLIRDYERTLDELVTGLGPDTRELAVAIASLPERIRGFDLVKEHQLEEARRVEEGLRAEWRRSTGRELAGTLGPAPAPGGRIGA